MELSKKQLGIIHILLSVVTSVVLIIPAVWIMMKPLLTEALAEDVRLMVKQEVKPLNAAFTTLIQRDIAEIEQNISDLEFIRDQSTDADWTLEQSRKLTDLERELSTHLQVMSQLRDSSS